MPYESRKGSGRRRAPLVIDAVADPAAENCYAPEPPARPDLRARLAARGRSVARVADRHAFTVASLTLALGVGWLVGAHSFDAAGAGLRHIASAVNETNARVDAVARSGAEVAALRAQMAELRAALDASRARQSEALAGLKERIDTAQRAPTAQIQSVTQRVAQMERRLEEAQQTPPQPQTTMVARSDAEPRVPLAPRPLPPTVRATIPPLGYVLRQANEKLAFVESRDGLRAVEPGQILPGAGRVHAIEKRGQKWIVVTSNGLIDSELY